MPYPYLWLQPLKTTATVDPGLGSNTVMIAPSGYVTVTFSSSSFTETVDLELWETPPPVTPSRNNYGKIK